MLSVLSADAMASADRSTIHNGIPSLVLMERAALRVKEIILENELDVSSILVLCGTGNNAADGVAVARLFCEEGEIPSVCLLGNQDKYSEDLKTQLKILASYNAVFTETPIISEYSLIIDAMFGIGLKRDISGRYEEVISELNESAVPVVSVDIPSGLNADNGNVCGAAVCADITVTFQYAKPGQLIGCGPACCGDLYVENIGIMPVKGEGFFAVTEEDFKDLPLRDESGNKGTFGKLLVIAGSEDICGAAYLCSAAALQCGIGMVKIFTSEKNRTALSVLLPEALITTYSENTKDLEKLKSALSWADVCLAGPGIGTDDFSVELFRRFLKANEKPAVLDADALNILSAHEELWDFVKAGTVITPHVAEMSRLTGTNREEIKENPMGTAGNFAKEKNVICVLKDARTVTAYPDGSLYINTTGCSALATAGSGDVLAGMTAGYLTRYRNTNLPLAAMAVHRHGAAGESAEEAYGAEAVTASDLLTFI